MGGLLDDAQHRPATSVLGPWMRGVMQPEGLMPTTPSHLRAILSGRRPWGQCLWLVGCIHQACMKSGWPLDPVPSLRG